MMRLICLICLCSWTYLLFASKVAQGNPISDNSKNGFEFESRKGASTVAPFINGTIGNEDSNLWPYQKCLQPVIISTCSLLILKHVYTYDVLRRACVLQEMVCDPAGENYFETEEECENLCMAEEAEFCTVLPEPGFRSKEPQCLGSHYRWYHNEGSCLQFLYTGCGGNMNNYPSESVCLQACKFSGGSTVNGTFKPWDNPSNPDKMGDKKKLLDYDYRTSRPDHQVTDYPDDYLDDLSGVDVDSSGYDGWTRVRTVPIPPKRGGGMEETLKKVVDRIEVRKDLLMKKNKKKDNKDKRDKKNKKDKNKRNKKKYKTDKPVGIEMSDLPDRTEKPHNTDEPDKTSKPDREENTNEASKTEKPDKPNDKQKLPDWVPN